MTLDASIVWEIRSNGATTNGGGFKTGASGTDYSIFDSAEVAATDINTASNTTIVRSGGTPFVAAHVGNIIQITAGTGFTTGWFEITAESSGTLTLDRAIGTHPITGGTGNLGGAMFWLDSWMEAWTAGNRAWVKQDGTHTLTAVINVAKDGTATAPMRIDGYKTTRGDADSVSANRPVIDNGSNNFTFDNYWRIYNLNNTGTSSFAVGVDLRGLLQHCKAVNTSGTVNRAALRLGSSGFARNCEGESTAGYALTFSSGNNHASYCTLHDSVSGVQLSTNTNDSSLSYIIVDTCTTGIDADSAFEHCDMHHITSYNCTKGIAITNLNGFSLDSAVIDNCTTGLHRSSGAPANNPDFLNNINFSNNTADKANIGTITNETTLAPGFVDAAGGDFETGSNMEVTYAWPGGLTSTTVKLGAVQNTGGGSANLLSGKVGG